jgi:hypothetical protein
MHGVVYVIRTPVAYKCNNYKQQSNIDTCFSSIHGYMEDKGIHAYGDEELSSKGKLRLFWPWRKGAQSTMAQRYFRSRGIQIKYLELMRRILEPSNK